MPLSPVVLAKLNPGELGRRGKLHEAPARRRTIMMSRHQCQTPLPVGSSDSTARPRLGGFPRLTDRSCCAGASAVPMDDQPVATVAAANAAAANRLIGLARAYLTADAITHAAAAASAACRLIRSIQLAPACLAASTSATDQLLAPAPADPAALAVSTETITAVGRRPCGHRRFRPAADRRGRRHCSQPNTSTGPRLSSSRPGSCSRPASSSDTCVSRGANNGCRPALLPVPCSFG